MERTENKEAVIRGRAKEIYLELCRYVESLPPGCALPSLRDLQKKYSAGQRTVVNALRMLDRDNKLERIPRKKIKVSRELTPAPVREASIFLDTPPWVAMPQCADAVLAMTREHAAIWQPMADAFNLDNHAQKVKIRPCDDIGELAPRPGRTGVDFTLFPSSPILLGLARDASYFMSLSSIEKNFPPEALHPPVFAADASGRVWGAAPTLTPVTIYRNGNIHKAPSPEKSLEWDWEEFSEHAESIRAARPELNHVHSLFGYMNFLFHRGVPLVDPETGKVRLDPDAMGESVEFLRRMVSRKIFVMCSQIADYNEARRMFNESETAMREGWTREWHTLSKTLPGCDILAPPSDASRPRAIYSELFCVMADSMNYDTCFRFICHALSPECQRHLASSELNFPARRDVVPNGMSGEQFKFVSEHIARCARRPEELSLPFTSGQVIEAGIDRLIRGGEKADAAFFKDLEKSCQWHVDNMAWK